MEQAHYVEPLLFHLIHLNSLKYTSILHVLLSLALLSSAILKGSYWLQVIQICTFYSKPVTSAYIQVAQD